MHIGLKAPLLRGSGGLGRLPLLAKKRDRHRSCSSWGANLGDMVGTPSQQRSCFVLRCSASNVMAAEGKWKAESVPFHSGVSPRCSLCVSQGGSDYGLSPQTRSPRLVAPLNHPQNFHHGRVVPDSKLRWARSWWSWSISFARVVSWSFRSSTWLFRTLISSLVPSGVGSAGVSSISTRHVYPCGVGSLYPLSKPLANRRLTVCGLMSRCSAASAIDVCIVPRLLTWVIRRLPVGYADNRWFGGVRPW